MIITCTSCSKKYMVDPVLFTNKERKVRCVACGFEWIEKPKDTAANANNTKRSLTKKIMRWPLFILVFAGFITSFFFLKNPLEKIMPGLISVYNVIGMGTTTNPIKISDVTCATTQKEDQTYVIVTGTLKYVASSSTPELIAQLYDQQAEIDKNGQCTKNCHPIVWRFKPKETQLKDGQTIAFTSRSPQPVLEDVARCFVGLAE